MNFHNIEVNQFRNFEKESVELCPGVNLFIGDNGQGKTNLLEALYFACNGKSFRPGKNENLLSRTNEARQALLKINAERDSLKYQVKILLDGNKKSFVINDKKTSMAQVKDNFKCILFSPESLGAIKDGPEARRELVDEFLLSQGASNYELISNYKRCLKSRNKILRDHQEGLVDEKQTLDLLESIEGSFLPLATKLSLARVKALKSLEKDIKKAMFFILDNEKVDISVDYRISSQSVLNFSQKEVYYALLNRLTELRPAELSSGISLIGPQKHDIQFLFEKEDSRYYCSQGQQRALILSFKMAQVMYHQANEKDLPLLLLDDVLSELDPKKRANLVEFLRRINSQIIITTTDLDFLEGFDGSELRIFEIKNGKIAVTKG